MNSPFYFEGLCRLEAVLCRLDSSIRSLGVQGAQNNAEVLEWNRMNYRRGRDIRKTIETMVVDMVKLLDTQDPENLFSPDNLSRVDQMINDHLGASTGIIKDDSAIIYGEIESEFLNQIRNWGEEKRLLIQRIFEVRLEMILHSRGIDFDFPLVNDAVILERIVYFSDRYFIWRGLKMDDSKREAVRVGLILFLKPSFTPDLMHAAMRLIGDEDYGILRNAVIVNGYSDVVAQVDHERGYKNM
jgi:hypothetical protein